MNSDFKDLLRIFAEEEVEYLIVGPAGGRAARQHINPSTSSAHHTKSRLNMGSFSNLEADSRGKEHDRSSSAGQGRSGLADARLESVGGCCGKPNLRSEIMFNIKSIRRFIASDTLHQSHAFSHGTDRNEGSRSAAEQSISGPCRVPAVPKVVLINNTDQMTRLAVDHSLASSKQSRNKIRIRELVAHGLNHPILISIVDVQGAPRVADFVINR